MPGCREGQSWEQAEPSRLGIGEILFWERGELSRDSGKGCPGSQESPVPSWCLCGSSGCPWGLSVLFLNPLGSSQLTINTAIVYMHRFYMVQSFTQFHRNVSAGGAPGTPPNPPLLLPGKGFGKRERPFSLSWCWLDSYTLSSLKDY